MDDYKVVTTEMLKDLEIKRVTPRTLYFQRQQTVVERIEQNEEELRMLRRQLDRLHLEAALYRRG